MVENTITLSQYDEVDTAINDIMQGENDLFNNYDYYDIIEVINNRFTVVLNFINGLQSILTIDKINDETIVYEVDLSNAYTF